MTSVAAPPLQSIIDEAEVGSTIVLKKGTYNVEGTLKINKDLTIQAEPGSSVEVTDFHEI